jgi:hypothetical protein
MLFNCLPFNGSSFEEIERNIICRRFSIPPANFKLLGLDTASCDLLCRMFLATDSRISIPEIKEHPAFLRDLPIQLQPHLMGPVRSPSCTRLL